MSTVPIVGMPIAGLIVLLMMLSFTENIGACNVAVSVQPELSSITVWRTGEDRDAAVVANAERSSPNDEDMDKASTVSHVDMVYLSYPVGYIKRQPPRNRDKRDSYVIGFRLTKGTASGFFGHTQLCGGICFGDYCTSFIGDGPACFGDCFLNKNTRSRLASDVPGSSDSDNGQMSDLSDVHLCNTSVESSAD